jgi:hypothetical protein
VALLKSDPVERVLELVLLLLLVRQRSHLIMTRHAEAHTPDVRIDALAGYHQLMDV